MVWLVQREPCFKLTELLQIPVHLFTAKYISPRFREDVLAEADPIFK